MLILGLLLLVVSGAAGGLLIAYNNGGTAEAVTMFGRTLVHATVMEAFVAGLVVAAVFLLGLWMIMSASRRARASRVRYREVRREARDAARERDNLARQLASDEPTATMPAPPAGMPAPGTAPTDPGGVPPSSKYTTTGKQPVITNIKPGDSPTR